MDEIKTDVQLESGKLEASENAILIETPPTVNIPTVKDGETMKQRAMRMPGWWATFLILLGTVYLIAPQQLGVLTYKFLQVALGVVLGYIADRALFRFGPGVGIFQTRDQAFAARILARALIVLAVMLGLTIGL